MTVEQRRPAPLARTPGKRKGSKEGPTLPGRFVPRFWATADARFSIVKELRGRVQRLQEETGADSYAKQILAERAVFLLALLETREIAAVESGAFDAGSYVQACNALLGLLRHLGLKKVSKGGSLSDYVQGQAEDGKAAAG